MTTTTKGCVTIMRNYEIHLNNYIFSVEFNSGLFIRGAMLKNTRKWFVYYFLEFENCCGNDHFCVGSCGNCGQMHNILF